MALGQVILSLFGANNSGTNVVKQTAEVFRENAENAADRAARHATAALAQYASEFHNRDNRTWLDAFADGMNRMVRPLVTIGIFLPIPATVWAPQTMAEVWTAMATLPAGYWAVVGIILPFYFGGRMQMKALAAANWRTAAGAALNLTRDITRLRQARRPNAALEDWQATRDD